MPEPVKLNIVASKRLALLQWLLVFVVFCLLIGANLALWQIVVFGACLLFYLAYSIARSRRPARQLSFDGECWYWQGQCCQLKSARVWSWLVSLELVAEGGGRTFSLAVLTDSCSPDQHRKLRRCIIAEDAFARH